MTRFLGSFCIAMAVLAFGACNGGPSPPAPTPATPRPGPIGTHLSGTVIDDNGSPVVHADVTVQDFFGHKQATTSTNADGRYEVVFETPTASGLVTLIHTGGGEYEHLYVQVLPSETADIVKNLRVRRIRTMEAGESILLSIDRDSSLAFDGDEWMVLDKVWEKLRVNVADAGTLTVDARPEVGGIVPSIAVFCVSVDDNCRFQWINPPAGSVTATVSQIVKANSRFEVRFLIPIGSTPQRYEIAASLQR
jgi:hypothetical protein